MRQPTTFDYPPSTCKCGGRAHFIQVITLALFERRAPSQRFRIHSATWTIQSAGGLDKVGNRPASASAAPGRTAGSASSIESRHASRTAASESTPLPQSSQRIHHTISHGLLMDVPRSQLPTLPSSCNCPKLCSSDHALSSGHLLTPLRSAMEPVPFTLRKKLLHPRNETIMLRATSTCH